MPNMQFIPHDTHYTIKSDVCKVFFDVYNGSVNDRMINLASEITEKTIKCNPLQSSSSFQVSLPPLKSFIRHLAKRAKLNAATFLTCLVYLKRLSYKLPVTARGMPCTRHRIFLASLIIATKYMNDVPLKNQTWALYSFLFNTNEVNLMERQLLSLLEYDLCVNDCDLESLVSITVDMPVFSDAPEPLWTTNTSSKSLIRSPKEAHLSPRISAYSAYSFSHESQEQTYKQYQSSNQKIYSYPTPPDIALTELH